MKSKLWIKLAAIFLLIAILAISLAGGIINFALNYYFTNYVRENEQKANRRIVESLGNVYQQEGNWQDSRRHLKHLEMMTGRRVRIVKNGRSIFNSRMHQPRKMGNNKNMMRNKGMGMRRKRNKKNGVKFVDALDNEGTTKLPIEVNSQVVAYAYITPLNQQGLWSEEDIGFKKTINYSIIAAGIIVSIIALVISFFIARRITNPLQKMTAVAQAMEEGDLTKRVEINSNDEIGILGDKLNELAAYLQKLEELRKNLTADIAHELRTPLTTIRSYIEGFQDGVMEIDERNLELIQEEVIRLVNLVDDLQELSVTEAGQYGLEFEEINLSKLIKDSAINIAQSFADEEIDLNFELDYDLKIEADRQALTKIIANLLSNAYKYTESGGEISVISKQESNKAVIEIEDTGVGIPSEELPYIFERFYRVDRSRTKKTGGTGIGLAIVQELVENHQGNITVNSEVGQGTKFRLCFPMKDEV